MIAERIASFYYRNWLAVTIAFMVLLGGIVGETVLIWRASLLESSVEDGVESLHRDVNDLTDAVKSLKGEFD